MIEEIYFDSDDLEHIYNDDFDIAINLDSGIDSCKIMSQLTTKERFGYCLVNSKPYPVNYLANEWFLMGIDDNVKKKNRKTYHQIIHEICNLPYVRTRPQLFVNSSKIKRATELNKENGFGNDEFMLVNLGVVNGGEVDKGGYVSINLITS
jgi:hypothetical protein